MPRFFVTPSQIGIRDDGRKTVLIMGDDASHISRSLRMKEGESITVCDSEKYEYVCTLLSVGETVTALVTDEYESKNEPPYNACLYQALIKGDKFDTVVQKAIECGVSRIVPVLTERSIVRLNKKECEKKVARWQRIADEAAKQCGRGILVPVDGLMTFAEAVEDASKADISLFCYEDEKTKSLPDVLKNSGKHESISFIIGAEGGFSPKEAALASEKMTSVSLGPRILRTETAPSFVLACLSYEYELDKGE